MGAAVAVACFALCVKPARLEVVLRAGTVRREADCLPTRRAPGQWQGTNGTTYPCACAQRRAATHHCDRQSTAWRGRRGQFYTHPGSLVASGQVAHEPVNKVGWCALGRSTACRWQCTSDRLETCKVGSSLLRGMKLGAEYARRSTAAGVAASRVASTRAHAPALSALPAWVCICSSPVPSVCKEAALTLHLGAHGLAIGQPCSRIYTALSREPCGRRRRRDVATCGNEPPSTPRCCPVGGMWTHSNFSAAERD